MYMTETPEMTAFKKKLGVRLRKYRMRRGLSVLRISRVLRVHKLTVYTWETGKYLPDLMYLCKLCVLYHTRPEKLLPFSMVQVIMKENIEAIEKMEQADRDKSVA